MSLSDELILQYGHRIASKYWHSWGGPGGHRYELQPHTLIQFARAVIAAHEAKRASCSQTAKKSTHEVGRVDEAPKNEHVGGAA